MRSLGILFSSFSKFLGPTGKSSWLLPMAFHLCCLRNKVGAELTVADPEDWIDYAHVSRQHTRA